MPAEARAVRSSREERKRRARFASCAAPRCPRARGRQVVALGQTQTGARSRSAGAKLPPRDVQEAASVVRPGGRLPTPPR